MAPHRPGPHQPLVRQVTPAPTHRNRTPLDDSNSPVRPFCNVAPFACFSADPTTPQHESSSFSTHTSPKLFSHPPIFPCAPSLASGIPQRERKNLSRDWDHKTGNNNHAPTTPTGNASARSLPPHQAHDIRALDSFGEDGDVFLVHAHPEQGEGPVAGASEFFLHRVGVQ